MKIEVGENSELVLKEVFNGVLLIADSGEELSVCMRGLGFEFRYNGFWYSAKNGVVDGLKTDK